MLSMNKVWALIRLGRYPFTLEGAFRTLLGGFAYCYDHDTPLNTNRAIKAALLVILTCVAVNYWNDYCDYEGDLYHYKRKTKDRTTGGAGVLVSGELPRWSAAAAALAVTGGIAGSIFYDRAYNPETTPYTGQTMLAVLVSLIFASQYDGYLAFSRKPSAELTTVCNYSIATFLCGYNFQQQDPSGFSFPKTTLPLFVLEATLQFSRLLVMNIVDIEADLTINKKTLAATIGLSNSATLYLAEQYILAALGIFFIATVQDSYIRWMVVAFLVVVLPQTFKVASLLRKLANGDQAAGKTPPVLVSLIMPEVSIMWSALLLLARRIS